MIISRSGLQRQLDPPGQILLTLQDEDGPKKGAMGPPGTNQIPQDQPSDTFITDSDPH